MDIVVIVIHLMVIVALVAVVLLQRSEGGALGIGGGNTFLSARGQGNLLTRATGFLAAAFFATSILLTVLGRLTSTPGDVIQNISVPATTAPAATDTAPATSTTTTTPAAPAAGSGSGGVLDELNRYTSGPPAAPGAGTTTTVPPAGDGTAPAPTSP